MPRNDTSEDSIDWRLTTWDGARREALRRWAALPLERIIAALEEMQELSERLASPSASNTQTSPQDTSDSFRVHEQPAVYSSVNEIGDTPALPDYADSDLAAMDEQTLIENLREHCDRVPRELIDACAARGDAMVQALEKLLDTPGFWDDDISAGQWWLRLHTAMILGLIPSEQAGRLLVDLMRRLDAAHDDDTQDWLAGNWPALFANKPIGVADTLRVLAEDRACDHYIRANAAEPVVRLACQANTATLEAALDWIVGRVSDEQEDWDTRLSFCHILLDFPRDRYRPVLERLAAQQTGLFRAFDAENIEHAHAAGRDQPGWDRFNDPWKFYRPEAITTRQQRWAEEDRQHAERSEDRYDTRSWHEPYVRQEPKIGRNDPCPCGSGKKYKKCCLDKAH